MNHLRTILAALLFAAAPAAAQTIKTLGYNTTNGNVVAATNLTFTNSLNFTTNARAATRTNLGGTTVGNAVFTAVNPAVAAAAIGLGSISNVMFNTVTLYGNGDEVQLTGAGINAIGFGGELNFEERKLAQGGTNIFDWGSAPGFVVTPSTSFLTNVTVNGTLTVKSLTTTDPVGWALDAVQTAAATNGVLTLPDAANVLRITNANAISSVTNGRLGAFYYLINQTTNNLTISNAGGITVQGGTPLTLGANQAATLVATGPTNASVAARGNLDDVTLGGTANTAPNQTASSGSSLMTRDLGDGRYSGFTGLQILPVEFSRASQNVTNGGGIAASRGNIRITSGITNGSGGGLTFTDGRMINTTQGQHTAHQGYGIYALSPVLLSNTDTVYGIFYGSAPANGVVSFEPLSTNGYSVQLRNDGTHQLRYVYKNGTNEVSGPWTSLPSTNSTSVQFAGINTSNGFRVLYRRPNGLGTTDWTVLTNVAVTWTWASSNSAGSGWSAVAFTRTNTTSTNSIFTEAGEFGYIIGGEDL